MKLLVNKYSKLYKFKVMFFVLLFFNINPSYSLYSEAETFLSEGSERADLIVVWKSKRKMTLFKNRKPLKTFWVRLGFNPIGHKQKEGDGRTPEGKYFITHKNPNSSFHLSLGISYPNSVDKNIAQSLGINPGKEIFIHGGPKNIFKHMFTDWTDGCIAVTDNEIEDIYQMVQEKTVLYIYP